VPFHRAAENSPAISLFSPAPRLIGSRRAPCLETLPNGTALTGLTEREGWGVSCHSAGYCRAVRGSCDRNDDR